MKYKTGFALSGGGSRGMGHIGMIKALDEFGITPNIISGTSAGALIGALYSYGYTPAEMLDMVKEVKVLSLLRPTFPTKGLLDASGIGVLVKKYIPENNFESLKIPLVVASTDIEEGVSVYFESGELSEKIQASCCVPGIFRPTQIDNRNLVDGGILDNLPSSVIRGRAEFLVGLHTNPITPKSSVKGIKNTVERSLLMAIHGNTIKQKELCDWFIEPEGLGEFGGFDLKKADEMVEVSYRYTKQQIKENMELWSH